MLKGLGEIGQILKFQKEMKDIQQRLSKATMEGSDSSGLVKVKVSGEFQLLTVDINEVMLQKGKGAIEKGIQQAVNEAVDKMKEYSTSEVNKIKESIHIPGLDQFFK